MTERWNSKAGKQLPSDPRIEAFLDEIEQVCRKHGMTISHEDVYGGFEIEDFGGDPIAGSAFGPVANVGEYNIRWLRAASDNRVVTDQRPKACPNRFRRDHRCDPLSYPAIKNGKCTCCNADVVAVDLPDRAPDDTVIVKVGDQHVTLPPRTPR